MNNTHNRPAPGKGNYGIKPATCVFRDGAPQGMTTQCYYCTEPTSQPCCDKCLSAQLDWREELVRIKELEGLRSAMPYMALASNDKEELDRRIWEFVSNRIKDLKGDG